VLRSYELAIIIDSSIDEESRRAIFERVEQVIASGGEVGEQAHWGRRPLAYPIDHKTEGFYAFVRFQAEAAVVAELERILLISDEVIRFKIVRLPERLLASGGAPLLKGAVR